MFIVEQVGFKEINTRIDTAINAICWNLRKNDFYQNIQSSFISTAAGSVSSRRLGGEFPPPQKKFQISPKTQQTTMLCSGVNGAINRPPPP